MQSRVKTGDVIQIRKNGPNYIALGKVRDGDGNQLLAITRNGNVSTAGDMKNVRGRGRTGKPKIHVIKGSQVKRVHGNRIVNMETVGRADSRLPRYLQRTTDRTGIRTEAPNVLAQLNELRASL